MWGRETKVVTHTKVIQVEKAAPFTESRETAESVVALRHQPGFIFLTNKLQLQADRLKHELATERKTSVDEYQFLQTGIFWCEWLKNQLTSAEARVHARATTPFESAAFDTVPMEIVGAE